MKEIFDNLSRLSVEELERVIVKAQELIQKKQREAERQEEIFRLQKRIKELQEEASVGLDSKVQEKEAAAPVYEKQEEEPADNEQQEQADDRISCSKCHELLPPDSCFCFYCGSNVQNK